MKELNEDLMERMLEPTNLNAAWKQVKAKRGAAGMDGISIDEFVEHIRPHWGKVQGKIRAGRYKPSAVRRVYIPKRKGEERPLGIPTILDRVLQEAMKQVLEPKFEGEFSEHSYGFRPGRSAHDAIKAAQEYIAEGKKWVVDIDLKSFFEEVKHDKLMHRIGERIRDKRMLKLIGRYLRAGIFKEGKVKPTSKGVPQGGPLSPLLANIYLDELDKELERRKLSFCRYADDCNIYVSSQKAAERVFASVSRWIEKHLQIEVNKEKSDSGHPWERQFLGYQPTEGGELRPAPKSLERIKGEVRKYFSGSTSWNRKELRDRWKEYIRGWSNYYKLANEKSWRRDLSSWIRHHIRKFFWICWHSAKGRIRNLRKLGCREWQIRKCPKHGGAWRISKCPAVQTALNNKNLKHYGFLVPLDFAVTG